MDTAAALERYTVEQVVGFARRLDQTGLTDRDFAEAAERLDQWGDGVFAPFGLGPADVARLRARFAAWPRSSISRTGTSCTMTSAPIARSPGWSAIAWHPPGSGLWR